MSDLSYGIQRLSHGAQHINQASEIPALVTKADETNNTCSITYIDPNRRERRNRDNVMVRLYGSGTDYFPKKGDIVIVKEDYDTCVVIARDISNYAMDVQSKMKMTQDIYSDTHPAVCYVM